MQVKDSRLYKTLKKAVRKEDHKELLRMLEMVDWKKEENGVNLGINSRRLLFAFSWTRSPQGTKYWCELSDRLEDAGHDCW